jgi:CxxC motif-containing protein (DUF1111 family)
LKHYKTIAAAAALTTMSLASYSGVVSKSSLRQTLLAYPVSINLGGDTTRPLVATNAFSFPAANLPPETTRAFSFGNRLFNTNWVEAPASVKSFDGLGPLFNRVSCSGCHTKDGRGQPPATGIGPFDSMLLRISLPGLGRNNAPRPVPNYGDQLSERAINGVEAEAKVSITYNEIAGRYGDGETYFLRNPTYTISDAAYGALPAGILISPRVAPQMIGLGLLDAVPDLTLQELADPNDKDGDGISGRTNTVWNTITLESAIGRFGWKASQPDLRNQNAAAALGDIGLTSDIHPKENCEPSQTRCTSAVNGGAPEIKTEFFDKLTLYTATLAVPAQRNNVDPQGAVFFRQMGCAACHFPTLKSGPSSIPEVANQTFHPYTDLLLHDMGERLSDHRPDFAATGNEWRTPPLWGLGLVPKVNGHNTLLHDGRARGFAEAILWHGGEAETSKEAFRNAPKSQREALIAFLKSL